MLEGYRGDLKKLLEENNIDIGDFIRIIDGEYIYEGILMPRYEIYDPNYITIKLKNGYNIGIRYKPTLKVSLLKKKEERSEKINSEVQKTDQLSNIVYIGTGGTIMSRIDYVTGAVKPSFKIEDLLELLPQIKEKTNVKMYELFKIFSEDITTEHWSKLAEVIYEEFKNKANAVIIAHGTDTLGYTSAALSFALQNLPNPVILLGAQRSLDRPSSDSYLNLYSAFKYALEGKYAGVFVVMHGLSSDEYCLLHLGTKVRKFHTSRRDAFKSVNIIPVAKIFPDKIIYEYTEDLKERNEDREINLFNKFFDKVFLLKFFPSISDDIIYYLVDKGYRGIVIEGTGLGHVSHKLFESIKYAVDKGTIVVMTSQCIFGRVNMYVYETGRNLLRLGVISAEDMLPETALVKLMWVLGNFKDLEEAKKMFKTNIAGEISKRTLYEGYL